MTTDNLRKGGGRGEGRKREKEGEINKETEIRKSGIHNCTYSHQFPWWMPLWFNGDRSFTWNQLISTPTQHDCLILIS